MEICPYLYGIKIKYMSYQKTTPIQLKESLNQGVYRFNFRKKDGSIRNALGTRNLELIPKEDVPNRLEDISNKSVVFFDLEERKFRSYSINTEVAVSENLI
jgi:hypothetical protein